MIISSILQLVLHENELGLTAPSGLLRLIPSHRGIEGDWKALLRPSLEAAFPAGIPAISRARSPRGIRPHGVHKVSLEARCLGFSGPGEPNSRGE